MDHESNQRVIKFIEVSVIAAGFGAALIGAVTLYGWLTGNHLITSVSSEFISMKANTAIAFLLCGLSLMLITMKSSWFKISAAALASLVFILAALTIAEYAFQVNLGIDELFFKDNFLTLTIYPGRMAELTSLSFLLGSIAILLHLAGSKNRLIEVFSIIIFFGGYFGLLSYLFRSEIFFEITKMAIMTSTGFMVLGYGLSATMYRHGMLKIVAYDCIGGSVARKLLAASLILPLVISIVVFQGVKYDFYNEASALVFVVLAVIFTAATFVIRTAGRLHESDQLVRAELEGRKLAERKRDQLIEDLKKNHDELLKLNSLFVGRELKMSELKKEMEKINPKQVKPGKSKINN